MAEDATYGVLTKKRAVVWITLMAAAALAAACLVGFESVSKGFDWNAAGGRRYGRRNADVRGYATESLRRLYRQRNLVLHGGRTRAIALDSTLRTTAALVGAGVDRIVHAHLTTGLEPLQVAARAEFEMQRAGLPGATDVTALLE